MLLIGLLAGSCMLLLLQRRLMTTLIEALSVWSLVCAIGGIVLEGLSLRIGSTLGHALMIAAAILLVVGAWPLRRLPGGHVMIVGILLNMIAMARYGRMPISATTLERTAYRVGPNGSLPGSKDVLRSGWLVDWLGDRFVVNLPGAMGTAIFSIGDVLILLGVAWAFGTALWWRSSRARSDMEPSALVRAQEL